MNTSRIINNAYSYLNFGTPYLKGLTVVRMGKKQRRYIFSPSYNFSAAFPFPLPSSSFSLFDAKIILGREKDDIKIIFDKTSKKTLGKLREKCVLCSEVCQILVGEKKNT